MSELENMKEKALRAYGALFSNQDSVEIDGVEHPLERTPGAKLRFYRIEGYSFLARQGSLIMWVLKGRRYLGQVIDGEFRDLRKKDQERSTV